MATQQLVVGQPFTAPLIFLDTNGNVVIPGPVGTLSVTDGSVTISLSADGQAANVTMTTTLPSPVTITWSDPAGVVPAFSVDVTDAAVVNPAVSGSFGIFVPGTTA